MGCVFEHTITYLSGGLKDTLNPLLSDHSSKLSKKLQTEAKIQINHDKLKDEISFSGPFSAILLANDIILAHLEQVKKQINTYLRHQSTSSSLLGNKKLDVDSNTAVDHHVSKSKSKVFIAPEDAILVTHNHNEQSNKDSSFSQLKTSEQNKQNFSFTNTNPQESHSLNMIEIQPLPVPGFVQDQIKVEPINEQADTMRYEHEENHALPSFDSHQNNTTMTTLELECENVINKHLKIHNKRREEIIDDVQHDLYDNGSNCTKGYSLRKPKPASWVKKLLKMESSDVDESENQESDSAYYDNADQSDSENENWKDMVEEDSDCEYETTDNEKDEQQQPSVEKKPDLIMHVIEQEIMEMAQKVTINSVNEEHCYNKKPISCSSSEEHVPVEKEIKIKENIHDRKFILDHADVDEFMEVLDENELEKPVYYHKILIGKCMRDKNDPSFGTSSCNLCTYVKFSKYQTSKKNLTSHYSNVHFKRELKFECEICPKKFGTNRDLNDHRAKHMYKKCEVCGKMIQRRTFSVHARRHNPSIDLYRFECETCNRKFTAKISLQRHIEAIHHPEVRELLPCDICGKFLSTQASLQSHKRFVHGHDGPINKNHVCDTCGKGFTSANKLKTHQQKHSKIPQHVCSVCLKAFRWKVGLKIHMKIHSETPGEYLCPACGKAFRQLGSLKRHKLTHTGERPFECDICKETFNDSSILRRHKLGKHKQNK